MKRVCVFLGAYQGEDPAFNGAARSLGRALVERRMDLVYGGSALGCMKALADSVLEAGGRAFGVMPTALLDKEAHHPHLTDLFQVGDMNQRIEKMAELADGFLALPGGLGTLAEFFEILTRAQLGWHNKPCALLDVKDYFRGLLGFLNNVCREGFLDAEHREMILVSSDPGEVLDAMSDFEPGFAPRWGKTAG